VYSILKKLDIGKLQTCPPHLQTVAALPWEVEKVIFQQDSSVISIERTILRKIPNISTTVTAAWRYRNSSSIIIIIIIIDTITTSHHG